MPLTGEAVRLKVRDGELAGTLVVPANRRPGVLLVHGWGGSKEQYLHVAHELAVLGCVCLTFDLTGHDPAQSRRAQVTRGENLDDVVSAFDLLTTHPRVDPSTIAVIGSSYGGYLAALLSEHRAFPWLALRAPALYRDEDWDVPKQQLAQRQQLARYRRERMPAGANRALRACRAYGGDVLIVESEHDRIVPRPTLLNYRAALQGTRSTCYRTIAGADHALSDACSRNAYVAILVDWMKARMVEQGAREVAPSWDMDESADAG